MREVCEKSRVNLLILNKIYFLHFCALINEETEYRSGSKLVGFFNKYGFSDSYGNGFPSRWMYTDEKLKAINGTSELDKKRLVCSN